MEDWWSYARLKEKVIELDWFPFNRVKVGPGQVFNLKT